MAGHQRRAQGDELFHAHLGRRDGQAVQGGMRQHRAPAVRHQIDRAAFGAGLGEDPLYLFLHQRHRGLALVGVARPAHRHYLISLPRQGFRQAGVQVIVGQALEGLFQGGVLAHAGDAGGEQGLVQLPAGLEMGYYFFEVGELQFAYAQLGEVHAHDGDHYRPCGRQRLGFRQGGRGQGRAGRGRARPGGVKTGRGVQTGR